MITKPMLPPHAGYVEVINEDGKHVYKSTAESDIAETPSEKERQIAALKAQLADTDYIAIKYAEGWLTAEEYAETKAQRQEWRDAINALETETGVAHDNE